MSSILITGANKGLGREAARRLLAEGHDVWAAARDPGRGAAAAQELGARPLLLDVTDGASVSAAAELVAAATGGTLDVLINNAGISGGVVPAAELTAERVRAVYEVNVFGPVRMLHAFLPLLARSEAPVVVNVSSGLGSLTYSADPQSAYSRLIVPAYFSSKAALNMLTTQYAKAFPAMRINSVDPGYTATDLNANAGTQTVTEGTDAIVLMATIGRDGPTGTFVNRDGPVPWYRSRDSSRRSTPSDDLDAPGASFRADAVAHAVGVCEAAVRGDQPPDRFRGQFAARVVFGGGGGRDVACVGDLFGEARQESPDRSRVRRGHRQRVELAARGARQGDQLVRKRHERPVSRRGGEPLERFLTSLQRLLGCAERGADRLRLRHELGLRGVRARDRRSCARAVARARSAAAAARGQ